MSGVVVRPVRFTDQVGEMQRFLELIGLRPLVTSQGGGWADMSCGAGRVALHEAAGSTSGALPGQTTLAFETDDITVMAKRLTDAGVAEVTIYDEAYGRVLTCADPEGATVAVDERASDLYGYQLHADPAPLASLAVTPVRFTDPRGPYGGFLAALGLELDGEVNPYYVSYRSGGGSQGLVGLHRVAGPDLPVVPSPDGGLPVVQLNFTTAEPLEDLASRLAAAGYAPHVQTEEYGSMLHVTDPDGQVIQVHAGPAAPAGPPGAAAPEPAVRLDHVGIVSATAAGNAEVGRFFAGILGCEVDGDPAGGYAEARIGTAVIALHAGARAEVGPHGGTLLQVACGDVDAEVAAIRARGGVIAAEPEDMPWGRSAYVAGPHGVMVELYQP